MKKALIVLTASAFVFTLAAPLFAAEVTVGGEVRVRGRYRQDRDLDKTTFIPAARSATGADVNFRDPSGLDRARLDERYRIRIGAKIEDGLAAFIELESYGRFGFGTAGPEATTLVGVGSEGAGVPAARFAWIDARVPGTPVTFRLGRQAQSFGHGYSLDSTVYGGDAITARGPLLGWNWEIGWLKARETDIIGAEIGLPSGIAQPGTARAGIDDDVDWYTFKISGSPAKNNSLEAFVIYHRDAGVLPSPSAFQTAFPGGGFLPTLGNPTGLVSGGGANEVTVGVAWDARFGPLVPRFEFNYQGGTAYRTTRPQDATISRNAFLIAGGADYNLTPEWRLSLDGGLGSGNSKNPADGDFDNTKAFFAPHYVNGVPSVYFDDIGNNGSFFIGNGVTNRRFEYVGLTNLGFVQLTAAWTPVPAWTFQAEAAKLFAHKTFDGMGVARCSDAPGGGAPPIGGCGRPSKDLGFALGGRATYRPYRNLTTVWWAGAFVPGNYFDRGLPAADVVNAAGAVVQPARKSDTAFLFRWHAIVSF